MKEPPHPVLAQGKVRRRRPVALVVAEAAQAKDAAELIEVEYEELPAVIDVTAARRTQAWCDAQVPTRLRLGPRRWDAVDAAIQSDARRSQMGSSTTG